MSSTLLTSTGTITAGSPLPTSGTITTGTNVITSIGGTSMISCIPTGYEQYAWAGFNFFLYTVGIFVICGGAAMLYSLYKEYNPKIEPAAIVAPTIKRRK